MTKNQRRPKQPTTRIELRYIARERAPKVKGSTYRCGFGFAVYVAECDDVNQAEELALRFYRRFPPADLEVWTFDFPKEGL